MRSIFLFANIYCSSEVVLSPPMANLLLLLDDLGLYLRWLLRRSGLNKDFLEQWNHECAEDQQNRAIHRLIP